jgi:hypothetical protein
MVPSVKCVAKQKASGPTGWTVPMQRQILSDELGVQVSRLLLSGEPVKDGFCDSRWQAHPIWSRARI